MQLDECRSLKRSVLAWLRGIRADRRIPSAARTLVSAVTRTMPGGPPGLAIGISRRGKGWSLAVRIQDMRPGIWSMVEWITRLAKDQVDVRV
ncbi:MAG: hypothetical protein ACE5F1_13105, partial [Planctomycetota bacterium]